MTKQAIKYEPLPKQKLAYKYLKDNETKFIVYGGAAGGGKSWLGCEWLMLCGYHLPGSRWFIGRNNLKDSRESVLVTWQKVAKQHGFNLWKYSDNSIKFDNGSEIIFLDLTYYPQKDPLFERFGSKEFTGGWIEEGGEVHYGAFDTLKTRVGRHNNNLYKATPKILITCNPKKNWLYSDFYKPSEKRTLPKHSAFIKALPSDNPHLSKEYIENLESVKDKARKQRLLYGIWEYDDEPNALIEYDAIIDIFDNIHIELEPGKKAITADIAGQGSDKFRVIVWYGFVAVESHWMPKSGGREIIDLINKLRKKHGVPSSRIVYDADGIGAFVGGKGGFIPGAKPFNNGAAPIKEKIKVERGRDETIKRPNYENLKTQCTYKMAGRINERGYWLKCITSEEEKEEITAELEQVKSRDSDKDGKLKVERKEIVSSLLGRSPDWKDVIMMREYLELIKKTRSKGVKVR